MDSSNHRDLFKIAITLPDLIPGEAERITELLRRGDVRIVHIRKPDWSAEETARLIESIPEDLHPQLRIHDHFELVSRYRLAGVHLNARNPIPHPEAKSVSRSMHSIEQLDEAKHYDYITLSPIFDSISKTGYRSAFSLSELSSLLKGRKVVALGGVTPDRFPQLIAAGFWGAAMSGYFFKTKN